MFQGIFEAQGKRRSIGITLISLIALTVTFIFSQSMLPSALSGAESDAAKGFLSLIFSTDTPFGSFIINNIRKIGHFTEYGILGFEVSIFICLFADKIFRVAPLSLLFGETVALLDETIQIFSGRGPSITDVWIDIFGFTVFSALTYGVYYAVKLWKSKKERNNG